MDENQLLTDDTQSDAAAIPQLSDIELRVLGVLMEKQLTTPDQYPLTLNSVLTACNQKSSRDPITHYQQGEVLRTLSVLENKRFVRKEYGSRADKYSQQFIAHLELGKKPQALLCLMMLRGPQTLSELQSRTQRMDQFSDRDELVHCVERLCDRDVPVAVRLSVAGQRGERIAHLFCGPPGLPARSRPASAAASRADEAPADSDAIDALSILELDVASLKDRVRTLEEENRRLTHQVKTLYDLTDNALPADGEPVPQTH